jgi:hypothetical protein
VAIHYILGRDVSPVLGRPAEQYCVIIAGENYGFGSSRLTFIKVNKDHQCPWLLSVIDMAGMMGKSCKPIIDYYYGPKLLFSHIMLRDLLTQKCVDKILDTPEQRQETLDLRYLCYYVTI